MGWERLVRHLLYGNRLPAQYPSNVTLNELILIPSEKMSLKYFIIWGYGSATIIFDANRALNLKSNDDNDIREEELLRQLNALGETTRIQLLSLIYRNPDMRAVEMAQTLSRSAANVSKHLAVLKDAQIIHGVRNSRGVTFEFAEEKIERLSLELMNLIRSFSSKRGTSSFS